MVYGITLTHIMLPTPLFELGLIKLHYLGEDYTGMFCGILTVYNVSSATWRKGNDYIVCIICIIIHKNIFRTII